jgi:hypothetical protein
MRASSSTICDVADLIVDEPFADSDVVALRGRKAELSAAAEAMTKANLCTVAYRPAYMHTAHARLSPPAVLGLP